MMNKEQLQEDVLFIGNGVFLEYCQECMEEYAEALERLGAPE